MTGKNVAVSKSNANLPAAVSSLATLSQAAVDTAGELNTGDAYGQFTKLGEWIFGQENLEVEEGSQWAINPLGLSHGFISWPEEGGKPYGEVMVPATQPLPALAELPEVASTWDKNASFQAMCLNGEDEGQQVLWKGSSLGFRKAWGDIAQKIAARAVEGQSDVVPIVELGAGSYIHKKYGKIMTPDIKVVGWMGLDGLETEDEDETDADAHAQAAPPEPEPEPEPPKRRRTRAKAEKPEPEPEPEKGEEPAPRRRRRRRKAS